MTVDLQPGAVVWAEFGPGLGREQAGRRPALVVSSHDHLEIAAAIATVVPCTSRDRRWPNHLRLEGPTTLPIPTFAMTEQVRTLSRERIVRHAGFVDETCLHDVIAWCRRWMTGSRQ